MTRQQVLTAALIGSWVMGVTADDHQAAMPGGEVRPGPASLRRVAEVVWELARTARADMRVPARLFADERLLEGIAADRSLEQLQTSRPCRG